jgi:hypothetical protein
MPVLTRAGAVLLTVSLSAVAAPAPRPTAEARVAAAAEAVPAGSSESVYYHGQTLVVVENNKASFYIIQPNNTLSSIEGATEISVNKNLFEFDSNGNLSLKGFDTAALGAVLSVGPSGTLVWSSVYTKSETDAKI